MPKARLKANVFDHCDIAVLSVDSITSFYCGGRLNPWVPCIGGKDSRKVLINNRWWRIDPTDWDFSGTLKNEAPEFKTNIEFKKDGRRGNKFKIRRCDIHFKRKADK